MKRNIRYMIKRKLYRTSRHFLAFFQQEAAGGILLFLGALFALVWANSAFGTWYEEWLHLPVRLGIGEWSLSFSLLHWINDGLMTIFFFVIGMEIKREVSSGELKSLQASLLPVIAAVFGMIMPALIYLFFNWQQPSMHGWGIPMATDIAFALGVLSLAGQGIPRRVAVFLTALAIVDDMGAIVVIALFYTQSFSLLHFGGGLLALLVAFCLQYKKITQAWLYLACGFFAWLFFLGAGIHPTIAGVLCGLLIPGKGEHSLLHRLETTLTPWSAYLIMPLFAIANAGVKIDAAALSSIWSPTGIGIFAGLFIGKPLGIFGMTWLLAKAGWLKFPQGARASQYLGAGSLGGIGFTMSLFIVMLAFQDAHLQMTAKISILLASFASGIAGAVILRRSVGKKAATAVVTRE